MAFVAFDFSLSTGHARARVEAIGGGWCRLLWLSRSLTVGGNGSWCRTAYAVLTIFIVGCSA